MEDDNGCPDMIMSKIDLGVPGGDGRGLTSDIDCCGDGGDCVDDDDDDEDGIDPGTAPRFRASGRDGGGGGVAMFI